MRISEFFTQNFELSDVSFDIDELIAIIKGLGIEQGSQILDLYGGAGIAGIVANSLGYSSVTVEVDSENFEKLSRNISKVPHCLSETSIILNQDSNTVEWRNHLEFRSVKAIVTSPPFTISEHNTDPSIDFTSEDAYEVYVRKLVDNFVRTKMFLDPNATVVVDIGDNITAEGAILGLIKDRFIELMSKEGFEVVRRIPGKNKYLNEEYVFFRVIQPES